METDILSSGYDRLQVQPTSDDVTPSWCFLQQKIFLDKRVPFFTSSITKRLRTSATIWDEENTIPKLVKLSKPRSQTSHQHSSLLSVPFILLSSTPSHTLTSLSSKSPVPAQSPPPSSSSSSSPSSASSSLSASSSSTPSSSSSSSTSTSLPITSTTLKPMETKEASPQTPSTNSPKSTQPSSSQSPPPPRNKMVTLLVTILLILSSLPREIQAFPVEDNTPSERPLRDAGIEVRQETGNCSQRTSLCVPPLLRVVETHLLRTKEGVSETKDLCLEYQEVLLCFHSYLANCSSPTNSEQVRKILGPHSVLQLHQVCFGQIHDGDRGGIGSLGNHSSDSVTASQHLPERGQDRNLQNPKPTVTNGNGDRATNKHVTSETDSISNSPTTKNNINNINNNNNEIISGASDVSPNSGSKPSNLKKGLKSSGVFDYVDSLTQDNVKDTQVTINVVTIIQNKPERNDGMAGSDGRSALYNNHSNNSATSTVVGSLPLLIVWMTTILAIVSGSIAF